MRILGFLVVTLLVSLGSAHTARENAQTSRGTQEVWEHHIQAWAASDLEAITADYSESSLLIVNGTTYQGKEQIKRVFQSLFEIFAQGPNRIDPATVVDRIVYITWHYQPKGHGEYFGTDTFVIENGVITVQTIASPLYQAFPIK